MPADNQPDPLDRWLNQQVRPLPPPDGTFELITRRARRRKIRRAAVSVAGAAAVAAAVAIAVPAGLSLHLSTTSTSAGLAAGSSATSPQQPTARPGTAAASASRPAGAATVASSPPAGPAATGYLPPGFLPSSVTWDSLSTGWVLGPAGTPGHCANSNPDICTSVARTDDGGRTWHGLPAPDAGGPDAATGVSGLRFLNSSYGWAFGPDLWATDDGGGHWHEVNTGGRAVTDLETASGRAYALFGDCTPDGSGDAIANCTSYTLMTAAMGSDSWTRVGGVPAALTPGRGSSGSALIVLAAPVGSVPATGYLVAPDGTLYAGPLDGGGWHQVGTLPCLPGTAAADGLPGQLMLATAGQVRSGGARIALVCATPGTAGTVVYSSVNGGTNWTRQLAAGTAGTSLTGTPRSLAALPDGTLILATQDSSGALGGIFRLSPGALQWQAATLSDPSQAAGGFSYVGMTSALQGVALGGKTALHAIWMTTDGGKTWQARPITSG